MYKQVKNTSKFLKLKQYNTLGIQKGYNHSFKIHSYEGNMAIYKMSEETALHGVTGTNCRLRGEVTSTSPLVNIKT